MILVNSNTVDIKDRALSRIDYDDFYNARRKFGAFYWDFYMIKTFAQMQIGNAQSLILPWGLSPMIR